MFGDYGLRKWARRDKCVGPNSRQSPDIALNAEETFAKPYNLSRSDDPMDDDGRVAITTANGHEDDIAQMTAFYEARLRRRLPDGVVGR